MNAPTTAFAPAAARVDLLLIADLVEPGSRVLEVGCGNGFSTERFRALVEHVDAFDYAENTVERARTAFGEGTGARTTMSGRIWPWR